MAIIISQPTAFQTPDAGQGGLAVTTPSTTGHANTTSIVVSSADTGTDSDSQFKTCRWFTFQNVEGTISEIRLKFSWNLTGALNVNLPDIGDTGQAGATLNIDYSTNGGGVFTNALIRSYAIVVGSLFPNDAGVVDISLPIPTSISQIQVRDRIDVNTFVNKGVTAGPPSVTADSQLSAVVSAIQLDVTIIDQAQTIAWM